MADRDQRRVRQRLDDRRDRDRPRSSRRAKRSLRRGTANRAWPAARARPRAAAARRRKAASASCRCRRGDRRARGRPTLASASRKLVVGKRLSRRRDRRSRRAADRSGYRAAAAAASAWRRRAAGFRPSRTARGPAIARNSVDLPAPLGPTTSVDSCGTSTRLPIRASLRPSGRCEFEVGDRQRLAGRGLGDDVRRRGPSASARAKASSNEVRRVDGRAEIGQPDIAVDEEVHRAVDVAECVGGLIELAEVDFFADNRRARRRHRG